MKAMDPREHFAVTNMKITHFKGGGTPPRPIKVLVGNISREFPAWSKMHYASSTLERLILVANLYLKVNRIWDDVIVNRIYLSKYYSWSYAILSCVTRCCDNNLIEFTTRWGNPFRTFNFTSLYCPAGDQTGLMCAFGVLCRRNLTSFSVTIQQVA